MKQHKDTVIYGCKLRSFTARKTSVRSTAMTASSSRTWLIKASLMLTGATFAFLLIAPILGYRLAWPDALRIFEIVLPVFLGYLGAASQFIFQNLGGKQNNGIKDKETHPSLSLIVKGPVLLFALIIVCAFVAFGFSNSERANPGMGMSVDIFAGIITAALGLLNVTTNVAISYLFSLQQGPFVQPDKTNESGTYHA